MHAAGVTVRDPEGRLIAALPEVAFGLSSSAILDGTLALRQIEIIAPRIRLQRSRDGRISFGSVAEGEIAAGGGGDLVLGRGVRGLRTAEGPGGEKVGGN